MFELRRLSRPKLQVFSTISLAAVFLIIVLVDTFNSSLLLRHRSACVQTKGVRNPARPAKPVPLLVVEEAKQSRSPELEVLKPTELTGQFDCRIRKFFGENNCRVQFFMTWISPAKSFRRREFFALETLFKAHPGGCLAILSKTMDSPHGYGILQPLLHRGYRILTITPELSSLFNSTPAQTWLDDIKTGKRPAGQIPLAQNLSNLIRLVVLYKYGGVYLDTDFLVLRDFSGLKNTIGAQSVDESGNWTRLNNAVLIFDKNHPLLYKFMEEFASNFDGSRWGHNGPYLVSRVVERAAKTNGLSFNFTVVPPPAFYPVDWNRIGGYFMPPNGRLNSKWIEAKVKQLKGGSYGVHLWNKQSNKLRIEKGSIIERLIKEHCIICKQFSSDS